MRQGPEPGPEAPPERPQPNPPERPVSEPPPERPQPDHPERPVPEPPPERPQPNPPERPVPEPPPERPQPDHPERPQPNPPQPGPGQPPGPPSPDPPYPDPQGRAQPPERQIHISAAAGTLLERVIQVPNGERSPPGPFYHGPQAERAPPGRPFLLPLSLHSHSLLMIKTAAPSPPGSIPPPDSLPPDSLPLDSLPPPASHPPLSLLLSFTVIPLVLLFSGCNPFSTFEEGIAGVVNQFSEQFEEPAAPPAMLLSWQRDPATTMTIDWYTADFEPSWMKYRIEGGEEWMAAKSDTFRFPYSGDLRIHRVELTRLLPDQVYEFRFNIGGSSHLFRTLPEELTAGRPVRFVTGGGVMQNREWMAGMNRVAAATDPDFAVFGGNLAFDDGLEENRDRWIDYLQTWSQTMITGDGRMIPHLSGIGNRDIRDKKATDITRNGTGYMQTDGFREREAPYVEALMAFPGRPGYGVLDFGDYLSLFLLDTDLTNPVDGEQTDWLDQSLGERKHVRYRVPFYHGSAWPPVRGFSGRSQMRIRQHWMPLFEEHGLQLAFETYGHAYKRTHPMKSNRINRKGVHYIGGGAWGQGLQDTGLEPLVMQDHLSRTASTRHFIQVTLTGDEAQLQMMDQTGEQFDELLIRSGNTKLLNPY